MKSRFCVYFFILTIPLFLGVLVWQSTRYMSLEQDLARLEQDQVEWVEGNKRLIAGIGVLSSAERIEHIARNELKLVKKGPEEVLQIKIVGRGNNDG